MTNMRSHKGDQLDPAAEEVTASLIAEAELYREMEAVRAEVFRPRLIMIRFCCAVSRSPYSRPAALFAIGEISRRI